MFDAKKFGGHLARLRKRADMTQSELADRLNLTRQAVSKYEVGDSFPDVSILVLIADLFGIALDDLINAGEPTRGESILLGNVAAGNGAILAESVEDMINLAPLLKPSTLEKIADGFSKHGIDLSSIVSLAAYLSDDSVVKLLENASFETANHALLEKLLPFLDETSKGIVFTKIFDGEISWTFIRTCLPYMESMVPQIEAAVVEGVFPYEVLQIVNSHVLNKRKGDE